MNQATKKMYNVVGMERGLVSLSMNAGMTINADANVSKFLH